MLSYIQLYRGVACVCVSQGLGTASLLVYSEEKAEKLEVLETAIGFILLCRQSRSLSIVQIREGAKKELGCLGWSREAVGGGI